MPHHRTLIATTAAAVLLPRAGQAAPRLNATAPGFTAPGFDATDSNGATVRLAALRGRVVVLEWTNDGCPFVQKWYGSGAMQAMQREAAGLGAAWLSVISSAPGEQGAADGPQANELTRTRNAAPAHVLLDPHGTLGRMYAAQTTPHIFIIGADGTLGYMGGADSIASTRVEDLARAKPYSRQALAAIAAGRPAPDPVTRPYGCTVKYAA